MVIKLTLKILKYFFFFGNDNNAISINYYLITANFSLNSCNFIHHVRCHNIYNWRLALKQFLL